MGLKYHRIESDDGVFEHLVAMKYDKFLHQETIRYSKRALIYDYSFTLNKFIIYFKGKSNPHIFSLFHLRNWLWSNLPTCAWCGKTKASKRAWTDLMLRSAYPYNLTEWSDNDVNR
jgi:hypothetical protein